MQAMTTANLAKVRDAKLWVIQYELTIARLPRGICRWLVESFHNMQRVPFPENYFYHIADNSRKKQILGE